MERQIINQLHEKYKDRDIIEMRFTDIRRAMIWATTTDSIPRRLYWDHIYLDSLRSLIEANNNEFMTFVQKGVLVNYMEDVAKFNYYPFEFKDGYMYLSLVITDEDDILKTAQKIRFNKKLQIEILDQNTPLCARHFRDASNDPRIVEGITRGATTAIGAAKKIMDFTPDAYFQEITYMQLTMVLSVNAYLMLHEKDILVSRITQSRPLKASSKKKQKKAAIRSLFYRYKVEIPEHYVPRKFDFANYTATEWTRCGHVAHVWTLKENAEKIATKNHGKVIWETVKKGKVKVQITRNATTVHRRIGNPTEGHADKIYK